MSRVTEIINKMLFYSMFLLGLILFLFNLNHVSTMIFAFGSFIFSFILSKILQIKGINKRYMILINLMLWLNLAGEYVLYYTGFQYYDKLLHLAGGFFITSMVYQYYSKSLKVKKDMIFFTVLGMLAAWEVYEYIVGGFFYFPLMGVMSDGAQIMSSLDDSMIDIICGIFGSIVYLVFKKEGIEKEVKKIGRIKS